MNKNFIIFFKTSDNSLDFVEIKFLKRNFLHLTGLKTSSKNINSNRFFDKILNHTLKTSDFIISENGIVQQKFDVLPSLMCFYESARFVGKYDEKSNIRLQTDKLIGNTYGCLGFIKETNDSFLVPNTSLKLDMRQYSCDRVFPIFEIYSKQICENYYGNLCYKSKNLSSTNLKLSEEALKKIQPNLI